MAQGNRDRGAHRERPSRFQPAEPPLRERSPGGGSSADSTCAMNIYKLPYEWSWSNLRTFIMDNVGEVKFAEMLDGEQRGVGYVEFRNRDLCNKAFHAIKGTSIDGRRLVLKETATRFFPGKSGKNVPKNQNDFRSPAHEESGLAPGPAVPGNTYGLNQQFLETLGIQGPLVSRIFVLNVDFQVNKEKLKDVFKMAGKIVDIEFHTGKDGKTKGMATIEYEHPVEAVQAISMFNMQVLYDRQMSVRMDRNPQREKKLPEGLKGIGPGLGSNGTPMRDVAKAIEKQDQHSQGNANDANSQYTTNNHTNDFPNPQAASMQMAAAATMNMNQPMWNPNMNQMLMNQAAMGNIGQNPNLMNANPMNMGMNTAAMMSNNMPVMTPMTPMVNPAMMSGDMTQAMGANMMANQAMVTNPMMAMGNMAGAMNTGNTQSTTLAALANLQQQGVNMSELATMLATFTGQASSTSTRTSTGQVSGMVMGNQSAATVKGNKQINKETKMDGGNVISKSQGRDSRRPSDMLVISNLPPSVSRQMVHEKFREAGEVKFVDMTRPGTAVVRYLNHWDAEEAFKIFDRTLVNGNVIEVQFYY